MHEMSIALSIVDIVAEEARREGATSVRQVVVEVGELSGVMPEALAFCYDEATCGTGAEGSKLVIEPVKAEALCRECHERFAPSYRVFTCPFCEGLDCVVVAGEELAVTSMEVV